LLYDWIGALRKFKLLLEQQFGLTSSRWGHRLPEPETWELLRVDLCYSFQFPSQKSCHQFLESLKRLSYPHKKPIIYDETILFTGATYSFKVYEKQPEFRKHDAKELAKLQASSDWIAYLDRKAAGILRVEATLRRQYLKVNGLTTVAELLRPNLEFTFSDDWMPGSYGQAAFTWLLHHHKQQTGIDLIHSPVSCEIIEPDTGVVYIYLDCDDKILGYSNSEPEVLEPPCTQAFEYLPCGRSVTIECSQMPQVKMQYFLDKLLGGCPGMQTIDQIKIKLSEHYKPAKVGRLVSFWLYVRSFGVKEAKEQFGHDSYYRSRRDLKRYDIPLLEPAENLIYIDRDFAARFRMSCPSPNVSNQVDDFVDGDNLLNLPIVSNE
jgi:hypothetical protein